MFNHLEHKIAGKLNKTRNMFRDQMESGERDDNSLQNAIWSFYA